jgi:hypothetical protein
MTREETERQLELDKLVYGSSFHIIENGEKVRIDPTKVVMRTYKPKKSTNVFRTITIVFSALCVINCAVFAILRHEDINQLVQWCTLFLANLICLMFQLNSKRP